MMPLISDTLTDSGHAWEVIVVDVASVDATQTAVRGWCKLPGYWSITLDEPVPPRQAMRLGLESARGDAVIMLDASADQPIELVPEMIARWELGHRAVYALNDPRTGASALFSIGAADGRARCDAHSARGTGQQPVLALVDRELARVLLR